MAQDLGLFPQQFLQYASGLTIFFPTKISLPWLRTLNFFPKQQFCTMAQDLDFFNSLQFIFTMAQDLGFFSTKMSSLRLRTYNFFFKQQFFAMAQDLDFFLQKFIRYGSGLRFISATIYLLWLRT